ncbi:hypothetical protein RIEGSTA812A_PEG_1191 [invertebrate metagenome]|uniref:Glycosyltransferase RgtA/B/C/D-like domain-containing protein n=1 Tax=invertebrate metagenome TaxID=1711999 RepID=A0A484HC30_9ZZZZ
MTALGKGGVIACLPAWGSSVFYSFHSVLTLAFMVTVWRIAALVSHPLNLSFDEAQYWIWAQAPAWGYFSKPPLIAWVIALTTGLCGDGEACVRSGAPLAYLVGTLALYDSGRLLYGPVIGFWSAAVFLTLPGVAFSAMVISVDSLLLMFWAIALATLVRALVTNHFTWWMMLGSVIGLGFLAKYAMLFFVVSLLLYLVCVPMRRPLLQTAGPWLAMTLALICLFPNILWNATYHFATLKHTHENAHLVISSFFHPDKGLVFIGAQFAVFGPILMTVLARLVVCLRWVVAIDKNASLWMSFALPVMAVMSVEAFLSRAHANWSAPAFVSATVLVVAWLVRLNRTGLLKAVLALHLAAATVLYNLDTVRVSMGFSYTEKNDLLRRIRGWDAVGHMLASIRAQHPGTPLLFDARKVLSPLVYYTRPIAFDAAMWNKSGIATNHFELITDLNQAVSHSFLLITEHHTASHIAPAFFQTELVAVLRVPLYMHFTKEIRIFRCDAFRGYA